MIEIECSKWKYLSEARIKKILKFFIYIPMHIVTRKLFSAPMIKATM